MNPLEIKLVYEKLEEFRTNNKSTAEISFLESNQDHIACIIFDDIRDEINQLLKDGTSVPEPVFFNVPFHYLNLIKNNNPYYADIAQLICNNYGVSPTPTMNKLNAYVSIMRLRGQPSGTTSQILKKSRKLQAFGWMVHLICVGCTVREASKKAVSLYLKNFRNETIKASTLEREYHSNYRTEGRFVMSIEDDFRKLHAEDENLQISWKLISKNTPLCSEEHSGERR
ncbi:hypothetical protein QX776_03175 [Alteromonadaceae bacterium BrNp21-10]|nr:hypothetical protein [Alteromonadaceae bacterium BrNp21-10]